ncbi:MAG: hypothetical protein GY799_31645 [Desulfobulbaceae bacterium]|nr:hypothetical protein [Desulfobulbaceae bacterium]
MKNQTMLSKTISFQKAAFTNSLEIFATMQQHGEDLLKTALEQSPWLPGSSKNACLFWADCCSGYLENVKSVADQGFAVIEQVSFPSTKAEENEPRQTQAIERVPAPRPAKKSPVARKKTVNAKKTEGAEMSPGKRAVSRNVPVEKPVASEKLEVKKSEDVKAATSMAKPAVASEPTTLLVPGNKGVVKKTLAKKD